MVLVVGLAFSASVTCALVSLSAFVLVLVRLELEVALAVVVALDVHAFLAALAKLAVEDLVFAELAFERTVVERVFC